jgi:PRC-barrel domain
MNNTTIVAAVFLTTVSSAALAQTPRSPSTSVPPPAVTRTQTGKVNLQQQVTANLQNSGFNNVKVMPDSFLVQATDKSGNPVTMFIGPNSMSEVTTVGANGQASDTNTGAPGTNIGGMFTSVPASDEVSSKVVGLDVYNNDHQDIGMIKDVAYNGTSVSGYFLGVGGFLGMGDHYVAVRPSAVKLSYDVKDSRWHATVDANAGQLKSAPEYKYPSKT